MNPKILELLKAAQREAEEASTALIQLRHAYEKAAQEATAKFSTAQGKVSALISMLEK